MRNASEVREFFNGGAGNDVMFVANDREWEGNA